MDYRSAVSVEIETLLAYAGRNKDVWREWRVECCTEALERDRFVSIAIILGIAYLAIMKRPHEPIARSTLAKSNCRRDLVYYPIRMYPRRQEESCELSKSTLQVKLLRVPDGEPDMGIPPAGDGTRELDPNTGLQGLRFRRSKQA